MNKGFTLLEALFGLIMLSLMTMLILQMMLLISKSQYDHYNQRQEMLFIMQIQRDLILTTKTKISTDALSLSQVNKDVVSYEYSNNNIIRQVNNKGGEVVMSDVTKASFEVENKTIVLNIHFKEQKEKITISNVK